MTTFEQRARLSALSAVQTPRRVTRIARIFAWMFLLGPLLTLATPWQQNVMGTGKVAAYAPLELRQTLESPVSGRIARWYVQEGDQVQAGDRLVDIADIDPLYLQRLIEQRQASIAKVAAKEQEIRSYRLQVANLEATRELQVATARQRLDVASQRVRSAQEALESARATLYAAGAQLRRMERLLGDGLVSRRDFEVAERDEIVARRNVNSAEASVKSTLAEQRAAQVELDRIAVDAQARIDSAVATANKVESELQDSRASVLKAELDVSRQQSQQITAPRDGFVLRVAANSEGNLIKQGDTLLVLVPDTDARAVELWVDGNDAPWVTPGRPVRLQFEGWPVVQFVAWPELAIGTFGGTVAFVDASDDGMGKFRVMVVPDADDRPWPSERWLRQGIRVKGWVLLNRVTLAFEIWRQMHGFPPLIPQDAPQSDIARKALK